MKKKPTVSGDPVCKTCHHYRPNPGNKGTGACRRFPPTVIEVDEDGAVYSYHPYVNDEDVCGEFSHSPKVLN